MLAVEIVDPREMALPDVGNLTFVDPETGRRRFVDTSSDDLRRRFEEAAAEQRRRIARTLRATGADHLRLRTDRDWVGDLIRHIVLRRSGRATGRRP